MLSFGFGIFPLSLHVQEIRMIPVVGVGWIEGEGRMACLRLATKLLLWKQISHSAIDAGEQEGLHMVSKAFVVQLNKLSSWARLIVALAQHLAKCEAARRYLG